MKAALALVAALLTPWVGPHLDRYLPLGWVLARGVQEAAGAGFWVIGFGLLAVAFGAWFAILTALAWLWRRRRN